MSPTAREFLSREVIVFFGAGIVTAILVISTHYSKADLQSDMEATREQINKIDTLWEHSTRNPTPDNQANLQSLQSQVSQLKVKMAAERRRNDNIDGISTIILIAIIAIAYPVRIGYHWLRRSR